MKFTKKDLIYLLGFIIIFYYFKSNTETMSNTDIKKLIGDQYKIDLDAIRNLSKLANDLTVNNKLIVPGGLEIEGDLTVKKNINAKQDMIIDGPLTVKKNINAKQDVKADGNGYFGPAYIGKYLTNRDDYAQFSHKDRTKENQYSLLQNKNGATYLNSTKDKNIYFSINDNTKMYLKPDGNFSVKQDIIVEGNGYFGPAYIGKYNKTRSDYAQFSHKNVTSNTQYAITQHEGGSTMVNAPSGKSVSLRLNDSVLTYIDNSGLIVNKGLQVKKGIYADGHIGTYSHFNSFRNAGIQRGCDKVNKDGSGVSCKKVT